MRRFGRFLLDSLIVAVVVLGGYFGYVHHNALLDWYYLRNYTPPAPVAALADQATMTDAGRKLFYRAQPQIDAGRSDLVRDCHIQSDKTIELGCYLSTDKIYLLDIQEPDLRSELPVTAAHETLHAAYDRLSFSEKRKLNARLETVEASITDPELKERFAEYQQLEPGQLDDELHSILGTEYANLPPDLETYYSKYFTNRAALVANAQQFNNTFDGLHTEIVQLDARIKATKAEMQSYLADGQVRQYNALVPVVNRDIVSYNAKVERYNQYASDLLGQESTTGSQ